MRNYDLLVMRVLMGLVFLYFGYTGVWKSEMWVDYVPTWTSSIASAITLVKIHGVAEIILGALLILNFRARIVASILFIDLLHIITTLNWGPTMVRDIGLLAPLFAIAVKSPRHE